MGSNNGKPVGSSTEPARISPRRRLSISERDDEEVVVREDESISADSISSEDEVEKPASKSKVKSARASKTKKVSVRNARGTAQGLGEYLEEKSNEPEPTLEPGEKALDLVFISDCTASMGSYIDSAKQSIQDIVRQIVASEKVNVRFGLVEYRDHPPEDSSFVTRTSDFTSSVGKMKKRVDQMSAQGGGDGPEAVTDGLHKALHLNWRKEAVKIVVIIADAPPHGLEPTGDGFKNGCPCGHDPLKLAKEMAEAGICIYSVLCEPAIGSYKFARDFFMAIARTTGGQFLPLTSASLLPKVIVASALEELSLQEVEKIFEKEAEELKNKGQLTEEALAQRMKERMADVSADEKKAKQVKLTSIYARSYSFTNVCKLERQTSLSSVKAMLSEHTEEVYDKEKSARPQSIEVEESDWTATSQLERVSRKVCNKSKRK